MTAKALFIGTEFVTVAVTEAQLAIIREWERAHLDDLAARLDGSGLDPDAIVQPEYRRVVFADDQELLQAVTDTGLVQRPDAAPALAEEPAPVVEPAEPPRRSGSSLTTDPTDPRLTHGVDEKPTPQAEAYLILSEEERAKGFIRPVRQSYVHDVCGGVTRMGRALAETYAAKPTFYGATYCVHCALHAPVAEFVWDGTTERVGS
jgi:hypothetical protein